MAETSGGAVGVRPQFLVNANKKLQAQGATKNAYQAMKDEVLGNQGTYLFKGPVIPKSEIKDHMGISRIIDIISLWNRNGIKADYKSAFTDMDDFLAEIHSDDAAGEFDPKTHCNDDYPIRGAAEQSWWFSAKQAPGIVLGNLIKDLALG